MRFNFPLPTVLALLFSGLLLTAVPCAWQASGQAAWAVDVNPFPHTRDLSYHPRHQRAKRKPPSSIQIDDHRTKKTTPSYTVFPADPPTTVVTPQPQSNPNPTPTIQLATPTMPEAPSVQPNPSVGTTPASTPPQPHSKGPGVQPVVSEPVKTVQPTVLPAQTVVQSPVKEPLDPKQDSGPAPDSALAAQSLQHPDRHIVINVPSRTLTLFEGTKVLATYPVGVGRQAFPTPIGQFKVLRKVANPAWENPYKASGAQQIAAGYGNPLGTRWIGFHNDGKGEYGMHGTYTTPSVGQYSSHGCIRMHIKDVEALFDKVEVGTPVAVTYNLTPVRTTTQGQLVVDQYRDVYRLGGLSVDKLKATILQHYPSAQLDEGKLKQFIQPSNQKTSQVIGFVQPVKMDDAQAFKQSSGPSTTSQLPTETSPAQPVKAPQTNKPVFPELYSN